MKQINSKQWSDYKWQISNSVKTVEQIINLFPKISQEKIEQIKKYEKRYRFQLTPYLLNCLDLDQQSLSSNPLSILFFPNPQILSTPYNVLPTNWEKPEELVVNNSKAFQWKYSDRILYRSAGCMSICLYCFEAHRVIDKQTNKQPCKNDWKSGIDFIKSHPEIREFVFSGGDPLLAPDKIIEKKLSDLRKIKHLETIRFNSSVLMHCPMRITNTLVRIFKKYEVTELGIHIIHPYQITDEFIKALQKFDDCKYGSIIKLAQIPLLRGINDNTQILKELLCKLEKLRIKGYYLLHAIPDTLGEKSFRTSVYKGVEILKPLYRSMSHIAWPEYVIVARNGKATVPMERNDFWIKDVNKKILTINDTFEPLKKFAISENHGLLRFSGTPEFIYSKYKNKPVIIFRNWKNEWEMYLDSE